MKFVSGFVWIDPTHYVPLARTAEEAGWDGVVLSDHLVHLEEIQTPYPYAEGGKRPWQASDPYPDVWVSIGAMAAVTERLRFYQGVYVVPLRDVFALAKSLGTASLLSGGRVALGLGLGWMREEFALVGQSFDDRAKRGEEMLEVMRKLWTGEMVEHHGRFYDFPRLQMSPAVPGDVPVHVGGRTKAALRRVARIGDGWIPDILSLAELEEGVASIRSQRRELGRSEHFDVIGAPKEGLDVDHFRRMEDAGVTHLWMIPWLLYGGDTTTLQVKQDALKRFGDEVIAKMR
ncbi:MAG: TIGR03619 family F420-dependent LLM class oxidoreductase [Myxococcota bacterium]